MEKKFLSKIGFKKPGKIDFKKLGKIRLKKLGKLSKFQKITIAVVMLVMAVAIYYGFSQLKISRSYHKGNLYFKQEKICSSHY